MFYTVRQPDGSYAPAEGVSPETVLEKLHQAEQALASIRADRDRAEAKMAELRGQDRQRSAQFQRAMAEKLLCQNLLARFALYGFGEE